MIMNDEQITSRINSPDNLLNRLRMSTSRIQPKKEVIDIPNLPIREKNKAEVATLPYEDEFSKARKSHSIVSLPKVGLSIDELIEDLDTKINLGTAHTKAISVLNKSLSKLDEIMDEELTVHPKELARMATDMSKIINDRTKNTKEEAPVTPQVVIYKPMTINVDDMNYVYAQE